MQTNSKETETSADFAAKIAEYRRYASRLSDAQFASLVGYAESFNCSEDEFFSHLCSAIDDSAFRPANYPEAQ